MERPAYSNQQPQNLVPGDAPNQKSNLPASPLPSVTLPKGGGAIHGVGEKYTVNAATGTLSMSIPLPISPGRNGFQPSLQLSYSSGAENGPFGIGWSLTQSSISRKTDKGVPRYRDDSTDADSDVFLLGGEDLVPLFAKDASGNVVLDASSTPAIAQETRGGYSIRQYSSRVEGSFVRVERWCCVVVPVVATWHQLSARCTDQIAEFIGLRLQPTRLSRIHRFPRSPPSNTERRKKNRMNKIRFSSRLCWRTKRRQSLFSLVSTC